MNDEDNVRLLARFKHKHRRGCIHSYYNSSRCARDLTLQSSSLFVLTLITIHSPVHFEEAHILQLYRFRAQESSSDSLDLWTLVVAVWSQSARIGLWIVDCLLGKTGKLEFRFGWAKEPFEKGFSKKS